MLRRFARVRTNDRCLYVELIAGEAHVLTSAPWAGGEPSGERLAGYDDEGRGPLPRVAPVQPSKILCVGRNYHAHAKEMGNEVPPEPMLFYKPPSSLLEPGGTIELPPPSISSRVEHEAELAIVIGRRLKRATEEQAADAVFGATIACDVTARDLQKKDNQWWRAKGMDTFCPIGPVVVSGLDTTALAIKCHVNAELRQDGTTADMIFSVPVVLAHVSQVITLEPGDVVLTGSPAGVGPLLDGDVVRIEIAGIGALEVSVRGS